MKEYIEKQKILNFCKSVVNKEFVGAFNAFAVYVNTLPTVEAPTWISCSERLPKEKEIVLITNDKGNVRFGQFRGTHGKYWIWKGNTLETVLAWMPLPEPYKRGDTND